MKRVIAAVAATYIALYIVLALIRISYPFELEWMEGSMVDHVQRVMNGEPLYVAPSIDFVPAIYTPLYYYVSAAVASFTGSGFLPLRLVSLLSSLGCLLLIFFWVRRETGDLFSATLSAGMFAATYGIGGFWFDIARADSLALLLILSAAFLLRFSKSTTADLTAGILTALAILTKQSFLFVAVLFAVYCLLVKKRSAWAYITSFVALTAVACIYLNSTSQGWFKYYVFDLPSQHVYSWSIFADFWIKDLLYPLLLVCVVVCFSFREVKGQTDKNKSLFYAMLLLGMLAVSCLARIKIGGYKNTLIPVYATLALMFGTGARPLLEYVRGQSAKYARAGRISKFLPTLGCLLLLLAFLRLAYNPLRQIPSAADRAAGEQLIETIRAFPGDVYVPYHGYLGTMAGKPPHAHIEAVVDIFHGTDQRIQAQLLENFRSAIRSHRFSAWIMDEDPATLLKGETKLTEYYKRQGSVFANHYAFMPVTGADFNPVSIYIPKTNNHTEHYE